MFGELIGPVWYVIALFPGLPTVQFLVAVCKILKAIKNWMVLDMRLGTLSICLSFYYTVYMYIMLQFYNHSDCNKIITNSIIHIIQILLFSISSQITNLYFVFSYDSVGGRSRKVKLERIMQSL